MVSSRVTCLTTTIVGALLTGCMTGPPDGATSPTSDQLPFLETATLSSPLAAVSWSVRKSLPSAIRAAASTADAERIYVLGGNAGSSSPTTSTGIYDPSANSWSTGRSFLNARDFAMAAVLSDGVHLVGGAGSGGLLSDHRVYQRSTNTWSARAPLPTAVDAAVARVVGGKLYIIGGGSGSGPSGTVQVFRPSTNTWATKRAMPTPRLSAASAVINGLIYVAGGQGAGITTTAALERYDPIANTWIALAAMPVSREALTGGNVNGQFCVSSGRLAAASPTGKALAQTFCYNPNSNAWTSGPNMITPRAEVASAEFGGSLYTLGGRAPNALTTRNVERLRVGVPKIALDFSQSFVQVADNAAFDLSNTWTLEVWISPRTAGNGNDQDIVSKWDGAPDAAYILQIDRTGVLRLVTNDGSSQTIVLGQTPIANTTWQHVAATFSSGTVRLYLNGVLDKTATGALTPINSSQPLAFGREGNFAGGTFDGRIDEVRLWKVVRTGSQLATWRGKRLSGSESGLVGYWRFDEGSGQMAFDATGRRHDGQLGTTNSADIWDPLWTSSAAPVQ
jgi:concanavalin A-like lectin/glucanase superfamily protein/Kelch motif protein